VVALAKEKPGEIPVASTGSGSMPHLAIELFQAAAGVKFLHVPYRGGGPALTGLVGNQVVATALGRGALAPHVQAGTIRLLASWGDERTPELPEVPTLRELGYPEAVFYVWAGLFAPKGTQEAIITRLRDVMRQAMGSEQVKSIFEKAGTAAAYLDGPEFARFMQSDSARLIPAVKKIGKVE
jgi:tripartite-type tricarboxylate transporter receptor subunit TctC